MKKLRHLVCCTAVLLVMSLSSVARADQAEAMALRHRARLQLFTAAIMMPLASLAVAGGAALIFSSICDPCADNHDPGGARFISGITLSALGYGGILASIPLLISGGIEHRRADRMLLSAGVAPLVQRGQTTGALGTVTFGF